MRSTMVSTLYSFLCSIRICTIIVYIFSIVCWNTPINWDRFLILFRCFCLLISFCLSAYLGVFLCVRTDQISVLYLALCLDPRWCDGVMADHLYTRPGANAMSVLYYVAVCKFETDWLIDLMIGVSYLLFSIHFSQYFYLSLFSLDVLKFGIQLCTLKSHYIYNFYSVILLKSDLTSLE